MFDKVICKYTLPLPEDVGELEGRDWTEVEFQTKDLDNTLSTYEITEEGVVIHQQDLYGSNPEEPLDKSEGPLCWLCTDSGLTFYDYYQNNDNDNDYVIEFKATFKDSRIVEIELANFEVNCNKARKEKTALSEAWYAAYKIRQKKWWYRLYVPLWVWPVRKTFNIIRAIGTRLCLSLIHI